MYCVILVKAYLAVELFPGMELPILKYSAVERNRAWGNLKLRLRIAFPAVKVTIVSRIDTYVYFH